MILTFVGACLGRAALVLTGTSYLQTFDSISSGSPREWTVYTGATSSSLGTEAEFTSANPTTLWKETSAGFYNVASADAMDSRASDKEQRAAIDRAIGIKQTAATAGYDPGAAIVLQIQNTAGLGSFALSLKAQILDEETRSTTWSFQYRLGDSGDFTTLGQFPDPGNWRSTTIRFNSSDLAAWNNQPSDIWFRIVVLDSSSDSGSRDMFAIDDFSLSFSAAPEPAAWGVFSGTALLAFCGFQLWRQRARQKAVSEA